jgi:hypothetical protein
MVAGAAARGSPRAAGGARLRGAPRAEESGVDPKAWLLQAQHSPVSASGMLKYANWPKAVEELTPRYQEFRGQQIGTTDYARTAVEVIDRVVVPRR